MRLGDLVEMSQVEQGTTVSGLLDVFHNFGLNVHPIFTSHFEERLWGRETAATPQEIVQTFAKGLRKYGERIRERLKTTGEFKATLKDFTSKLNIVFALEKSAKTPRPDKYNLYCITLMRKPPKLFVVRSGETLVVEGVSDVDGKSRLKRKKRRKPMGSQQPKQTLIKQLLYYTSADAT